MIAALLFSALLFPVSFMLGEGAYFEQADAAQHVSGWLLFAADSWRFPLLVTQRVDAPTGVAIFLTDSIPLVALVLKPVHNLLPEGFHYFGLWHIVIRIGQAIGGTYLLRALGCRNLFATLVTAVFFLNWPPNLFRFGHTALATHALLLFALGFYVRARRSAWSNIRAHLAFAILAATAILTHPYLGIVVLAVQTAFAIDRAWLERAPIPAFLGLAATGGGLALVLWPLGYFSNTIRSSGGYAHYSMNLLSAFCGSDYAPCGLMNATGGQYEGMNTLGLGVFILLPVALYLARTRLLALVTSSPGFVLVVLGLTVYSVTNIIWVGPFLIAHYQIPRLLVPLTEVFRVSGRFFWLVGYATLAGTLAVLLLQKRCWANLLIVFALAVQWMDTASFRDAIREQASAPAIYNFAVWKTALPDLKHVVVYPRYHCDPTIPDAPYAFLQLAAAKLGVTINTSYVARPTMNCIIDRKNNPALLGADTLLVSLISEAQSDQPAILRSAMTDGRCRRVTVRDQSLLMCSNDPALDWSALGSAARLAAP